MDKCCCLLLVLCIRVPVWAQTRIALPRQSQSMDFSGFPTTKPMKTGATLPATCGVAEMFFNLAALPGLNVYECPTPNVWVPIGGISAPSYTTVGNLPQFSNTTGTAISAGLGVVTTVGSPGADTNIPTEKSVRAAIAAAVKASGNLPTQTGVAGYLTTNGLTASWGNITTGGSGALDCATIPAVCDIATAIVPLKPAANSWTGANDFSGATFLRVVTGSGVPTTGCSVATKVGSVYMRADTQASGASLFVCSQTGSGTYSWENVQTSGTAPLPVFNAPGTAMSDHMVTGVGSFHASTATITLSGAAAFTSATSYVCTGNDVSNATAVLVSQITGVAVTFSINGGSASDNFNYICVGN